MEEKNTILIVDDEENNVELLCEHCFLMGYKTIKAYNGTEAVEISNLHRPDLIIMDVRMPHMDGFEATERIKSNPSTAHIPIIIVTSLDTRKDKLTGISKGANDFLNKPIDFEELKLRIENNLRIKHYLDFLKTQSHDLAKEVFEKKISLNDAFAQLKSAQDEVKEGYIETLQRLTMAAEYKDPETGSHIKRITFYTKELAIDLGLDNDFIEKIFHASAMHDIGKVGIPDHILLKNGPLDRSEWEVIKTHSAIGANILKNSKSPFVKMGEDIAYAHHERWDGSGYPRGLKGEEIPLSARIMNICDQYDALRSSRPYKSGFDHQTTMNIITIGDKRTIPEHFDPDILHTFKTTSKRMNEIFQSFKDHQSLDSLQIIH